MLKLIQLATGLGVAFLLIDWRETDPSIVALHNPYVIGVLSLFAAFAVTALPIGLYYDIPRWYRSFSARWVNRDLKRGSKPLGSEDGLHKGIPRHRASRPGK